MDAVKFLREFSRMCSKHDGCNDCPMGKVHFCMGDYENISQEESERIVGIVEKWSKKNPEEFGKKYVIEIDTVGDNGFSFRIKGTDCWLYRSDLKKLEEYKEGEE